MDIRSIQLIAYTDLKSIRLKEILTTQADDSHVKFKEYNFNHFPHIPVRRSDQPFSHPPLIAIISRTLLKFVTSTPYKEEFIQHITGYHPNILISGLENLAKRKLEFTVLYYKAPSKFLGLSNNEIYEIYRLTRSSSYCSRPNLYQIPNHIVCK